VREAVKFVGEVDDEDEEVEENEEVEEQEEEEEDNTEREGTGARSCVALCSATAVVRCGGWCVSADEVFAVVDVSTAVGGGVVAVAVAVAVAVVDAGGGELLEA